MLRIGHLSTFYHTAVLLMADGELESRLGVELEWRLFGTGPAIMEAFSRREIDLAYVGLPPAIIGMAQGIPAQCIAGGHIEGTIVCGRQRFTGYPDVPDLGNLLSQFRGMAIGVPGRGSIHDVILKESLERFGLSDAVRVRNFRWADEITEAMARDDIPAAFGTPALAVSAARFAGGKLLYPASRVWPDNPSYGIIAADGTIASSRSVLLRFLQEHEQAASVLRSLPEKAAAIIAGYVGFVDEEFVRETLAISPRYCAALTRGYVDATMGFVAAMKRLGYLEKELPEDRILDSSLIREVHPGPDHYHAGGIEERRTR